MLLPRPEEGNLLGDLLMTGWSTMVGWMLAKMNVFHYWPWAYFTQFMPDQPMRIVEHIRSYKYHIRPHVSCMLSPQSSQKQTLWTLRHQPTPDLEASGSTSSNPYYPIFICWGHPGWLTDDLHLSPSKIRKKFTRSSAPPSARSWFHRSIPWAPGGARWRCAACAAGGFSMCKFMVHVWLVKCKVHSQLSIFHYYVWNMICKHKYGIHRFHPIPDLSGGVHLTSHQKWKKITWDNRKATKKATRSEWGMIIGRLPAWRLVDLCTKPTISMKEDPQLEAKFWCENQSCKVLIRCPLSLLGAQSLYVKDGERSQVAPDRKPQNVAQYPTVWSRFFLVRISPRFFPIIPSFLRFLLEIQEYPWISQKFPKKNHETQPSTAAFSIQGAAAISTALEVSQATRRLTVLRWMLRFRPFFLSDFEWL